jgi:glycine betaine/proline transport system permease protein
MLQEFPSLSKDIIRALKKTLDSAFSDFSRNWGESIEHALFPLQFVLDLIETALTNCPWMITLVLILGFTYSCTKNFKFLFFTLLVFLYIGLFGMWEDTMITLSAVLLSLTLCLMIGIPIGTVISYNDKAKAVALPVLDFMQAVPTFVYLIPVIMLLGLGNLAGLLAICIYSIPPVIRFTDIGLRGVDKGSIEAAKSLGLTQFQILRKVKMPLALLTIFSGINQNIMLILGMVVIASMIGLDGLGANVLRAISNQYLTLGLLNGMSLVLLAVYLDRLFQLVGASLQPWRNLQK